MLQTYLDEFEDAAARIVRLHCSKSAAGHYPTIIFMEV
jgi:hypothetical protein